MRKSLTRALLKVAVMALFVCAVIAGTNLGNSAATDRRADDGRRQHVARLRDGVGELRLPSSDSSPGQVRASVNHLAHYVSKRSGLRLSGAAKDRLAALEERTLGGHARRVSTGELEVILTQVIVERVAALTDQEIDQAIESLRGFNARDLPAAYRKRPYIKYRASWGGPKVTPEVVEQAKSFRDQARRGDATFTFLLRGFVGKEIDTRARLLNEAAPAQFPQGIADSPSSTQLTPAQALLVAYSVLSDDHLLDTEANHEKNLRLTRDSRAKLAGGYYPGHEGQFAYGDNGYLHASPVGLFLDESSVARLLQLVEERSAR